MASTSAMERSSGIEQAQAETPAQRRVRDLAEQTCARIAQVAPAGLALWPETLKRVAAADAQLLGALEAVERAETGTELARRTSDARGVANGLVSAWRLAGVEWTVAGSPA